MHTIDFTRCVSVAQTCAGADLLFIAKVTTIEPVMSRTGARVLRIGHQYTTPVDQIISVRTLHETSATLTDMSRRKLATAVQKPGSSETPATMFNDTVASILSNMADAGMDMTAEPASTVQLYFGMVKIDHLNLPPYYLTVAANHPMIIETFVRQLTQLVFECAPEPAIATHNSVVTADRTTSFPILNLDTYYEQYQQSKGRPTSPDDLWNATIPIRISTNGNSNKPTYTLNIGSVISFPVLLSSDTCEAEGVARTECCDVNVVGWIENITKWGMLSLIDYMTSPAGDVIRHLRLQPSGAEECVRALYDKDPKGSNKSRSYYLVEIEHGEKSHRTPLLVVSDDLMVIDSFIGTLRRTLQSDLPIAQSQEIGTSSAAVSYASSTSGQFPYFDTVINLDECVNIYTKTHNAHDSEVWDHAIKMCYDHQVGATFLHIGPDFFTVVHDKASPHIVWRDAFCDISFADISDMALPKDYSRAAEQFQNVPPHETRCFWFIEYRDNRSHVGVMVVCRDRKTLVAFSGALTKFALENF